VRQGIGERRKTLALTDQQAPFTEPYALAGNPRGYRSKGPTAEAVKRALAHLKFLPWKEDGDWDRHWNADVNEAAARWKSKRGIIPAGSTDGSWGEQAHGVMRTAWYAKGDDHLPAFDGYAQSLLQDEWAKASGAGGNAEAKVRAALTEFASKGLAAGSKWTYSQNRAVKVSIDPSGYVTSDCSGSVIQAFNYAKRSTGLDVPDPSKYAYAGWGNTWDDLDGWAKVSDGRYEVGDLAHYDGHVCMCMKAGDADSADWWSFGSEPPSKRKLYYRTDYRFVVRPPLVAS